MKVDRTITLLAILCISTVAPAIAQEVPVSRILVMIQGDAISSTSILYDYADLMNMGTIQNLADQNPAEAVPFQELIAQLPDPLQGWTADTPQGMILNTGTFSYSFATNEYSRTAGDEEVEVIIYDTVGEQTGPWFALWYGSGFYYENQDGYLRSITYKGYYGVEHRDNTDNSGYLMIGLARETVPEIGVLGILALAIVPEAIRRRRPRRS